MRSLVIVGMLVFPTALPAIAEDRQSYDLRNAVPEDVYLLVHGRHNPERDYQRAHYAQIWQTVEETKIVEKVAKIISESVPEQELGEVKSVLEDLRTAAEPIDLNALVEAEEAIYTQRMRGVTNQQLALLRLGPAAEEWEEGIQNLMGLAEKYSQAAIPVQSIEHEGVTITILALPAEGQFVPMVARLDDILFLASSEDLLKQSISQIVSGEGTTKFDDPRLQAALEKLPEPEDALVFYDGRTQFSQMKKMGDFIRQASGGDPGAERVAGLMEALFDELSVVDYEITVEYTEGNQNLSQAYGRLLPDVEHKMLYKAVASGQPFDDWQAWVPSDAISYSLQTGFNLHPVYEGVLELVRERFPEAEEGLQQFEQVQEALGVHLDRDILQSFSGESVSITLPAANASILGSPDSVVAMRCHNPDRIRKLLHRGVEALQSHPIAKTQQIRIIESKQLEGFEQVSAVVLNAFGVQPTYGFVDGWMIIGSNTSVIERVLAVRSGDANSVTETDKFRELAPEISGPVAAISYNNLGENIRAASKMLGQAGAVAQLAIGMVGMQADAEELKPLRDFLGLLPDVARIVAKFDFLEEQISVTQGVGDDPNAYLRKSVIQVRPATL